MSRRRFFWLVVAVSAGALLLSIHAARMPSRATLAAAIASALPDEYSDNDLALVCHFWIFQWANESVPREVVVDGWRIAFVNTGPDEKRPVNAVMGLGAGGALDRFGNQYVGATIYLTAEPVSVFAKLHARIFGDPVLEGA